MGMWIGENESAKYWLGVLNEIMNRGVEDIMLVCARLRHVAGTQWGAKRYMNMDHLAELDIQNDADNIAN